MIFWSSPLGENYKFIGTYDRRAPSVQFNDIYSCHVHICPFQNIIKEFEVYSEKEDIRCQSILQA